MKVPTGFSIVVFEGSMGTLLSAIYGMLCARWWGPEISGITSFAFNLASTFSFLACLSIEQFVIARFVTGRNLDYLFMATVVLRAGALTLSLFGVVLSSLAAHEFLGAWAGLPTLCFLQMALAAIDLLRLRSQALGLLHRQSLPRILVAIVFFMLKSAAIIYLPAAESVWMTAWLSALEAATLLVISVIITRLVAPLKPNRRVSASRLASQLRRILSASLPLFAAGVVVMLFFKLDYFVLAQYASARDIGHYSAAMRVMEMYVAVANLALMQFYPGLAAAFQSNRDRYIANLRFCFRFAYGAATLIVIANLALGERLILWLLGPAYEPVAHYSTAFCLLGFPLLSGTVRAFAISLEQLHRTHFQSALLGFGLAIPLLLMLVPKLGFRGALLTDIIAYTASAMLSTLIIPSLRPLARHQWRPGLR